MIRLPQNYVSFDGYVSLLCNVGPLLHIAQYRVRHKGHDGGGGGGGGRKGANNRLDKLMKKNLYWFEKK